MAMTAPSTITAMAAAPGPIHQQPAAGEDHHRDPVGEALRERDRRGGDHRDGVAVAEQDWADDLANLRGCEAHREAAQED